jgi:hypothetical protein
MRTTVTLEPDVDALVRKSMRERGVTFRQAVNDAIRAGLRGRGAREQVRIRTYPIGLRPEFDWDKAMHIAAELEDEELLRKYRAGR